MCWFCIGMVRPSRDLFPLPVERFYSEFGGDTKESVSRAVRRRGLRHSHCLDWAREAGVALNELAGVDGRGGGPPTSLLAQRNCMERLVRAAVAAGPPPCLTSTEALGELRASHGYCSDATTCVPLDISLLALPEVGFCPIDLARAGPVGQRIVKRLLEKKLLDDEARKKKKRV